MLKDELPEGGVNELLKSPSGREYLKRLQEIYWKEILQPSDPRFEKVYGKQIAETRRKLEEKIRQSKLGN